MTKVRPRDGAWYVRLPSLCRFERLETGPQSPLRLLHPTLRLARPPDCQVRFLHLGRYKSRLETRSQRCDCEMTRVGASLAIVSSSRTSSDCGMVESRCSHWVGGLCGKRVIRGLKIFDACSAFLGRPAWECKSYETEDRECRSTMLRRRLDAVLILSNNIQARGLQAPSICRGLDRLKNTRELPIDRLSSVSSPMLQEG